MSAIFNRQGSYTPANRGRRTFTMLMVGAAFVAGVGSTMALSRMGPAKSTPNPWGGDVAKSETQPKAQAAKSQVASKVELARNESPRVEQPAVRPEVTTSKPETSTARVIGGDRILPAPRLSAGNTGNTGSSERTDAGRTRDSVETIAESPAQRTNAATPARLNEYDREKLAKAAAEAANAELAGGTRGAATTRHAAVEPSAQQPTEQIDAAKAEEAAQKARKAKARKAARERQLARARQEQERAGYGRGYGYERHPSQVFAQDYGYRRPSPGGWFGGPPPGAGIW
jgi:hypothetical protein